MSNILHDVDSKKISLFGYLYVEEDGFEKILVRRKSEKWKFPVNVEISLEQQTIDEAIDTSITNIFMEVGQDASAFLLHNYKPYYHRVFIGPNLNSSEGLSEGHSGFFFKVKLEKEIPIPNEFSWFLKSKLFETPENCLDNIELTAIKHNCVYTHLGRKVLDCVDVLVFRINNGQVEFLILKREDPIRGFVGWEYPKGGMQFHENALEAALHRLKIETGSNKYEYRGYLGYQVVDVSERKLAEYNTLMVHGLSFLFHGVESDVVPEDFKVILRSPTWINWEKARESIWMQTYGPVFFDRWLADKEMLIKNIV